MSTAQTGRTHDSTHPSLRNRTRKSLPKPRRPHVILLKLNIRRAVCVAILYLLITPALADNQITGGGEVSVLEMEVTERTSRGVIDSCELRYLIGFEDYIYRQGAVSAIRGAISMAGFAHSDKVPALILKVTAFDMSNGNPVLSPLNYAFIEIADKSFAGKEITKFTCEDGGVCMAYSLIQHPSMWVWTEGFRIGFTREGGNSDMTISLGLSDIGIENQQKLARCQLKLIDMIRNKMGAN